MSVVNTALRSLQYSSRWHTDRSRYFSTRIYTPLISNKKLGGNEKSAISGQSLMTKVMLSVLYDIVGFSMGRSPDYRYSTLSKDGSKGNIRSNCA